MHRKNQKTKTKTRHEPYHQHERLKILASRAATNIPLRRKIHMSCSVVFSILDVCDACISEATSRRSNWMLHAANSPSPKNPSPVQIYQLLIDEYITSVNALTYLLMH